MPGVVVLGVVVLGVVVLGVVVLDSGRGVVVFGSAFGVVSVRGVAVLGSVLGVVVVRDGVLPAGDVPAFGSVRGAVFVPAAGSLAADFKPAGGVCRAAARGFAATSVAGCPPLALANDALLARAAATCAV